MRLYLARLLAILIASFALAGCGGGVEESAQFKLGMAYETLALSLSA